MKKYININIKNEEKDKENNVNIYLKKIKKYENDIYEDIMLNDKREIKGIVVDSNGAKYKGIWRNDLKMAKDLLLNHTIKIQ